MRQGVAPGGPGWGEDRRRGLLVDGRTGRT